MHRVLIHRPFRPRFYYGWVMLPIAMLSVMSTAPAQTYGISVFLPFIRSELGLTPAQTATAYMLGTLLASLPLTWVGAGMDRFGPRRTMTLVILLFCSACLLMSRVTGLLTLFGAFLLLRLFGQGALTMLSANTLAYWFHHRLGRVSGIKAMGAAATIALAPTLHLLLIDRIGWRSAYMLLGLFIASLLLPLMLVLYRNRPEEVGQVLEGMDMRHAAKSAPVVHDWVFRDAVRTRAYWIMAGGIALWALVGTAIAFCAGSIFEARGLSLDAAATSVSRMFAAMGTTLLLTHVLAGWLVDHIRVQYVLSMGMLMMAAVGLALVWPGSEQHSWRIGIGMGICQSLISAVSATVWVRYFGRAALGQIRGSTFTLLVAASSVGPFLVDGGAALLGSYQAVLLTLACLPLPLALAAFWAVPPTAETR